MSRNYFRFYVCKKNKTKKALNCLTKKMSKTSTK